MDVQLSEEQAKKIEERNITREEIHEVIHHASRIKNCSEVGHSGLYEVVGYSKSGQYSKPDKPMRVVYSIDDGKAKLFDARPATPEDINRFRENMDRTRENPLRRQIEQDQKRSQEAKERDAIERETSAKKIEKEQEWKRLVEKLNHEREQKRERERERGGRDL